MAISVIGGGDSSRVPVTRKINNNELTKDITLTASDVGAAITNLYTVSLTTTWSGTSSPYTQVVAVTGIEATDTPIIDIVPTTSGYDNEQEAWANVFKATCAKDSITFYAKEKTSVQLSLQIKVVR